MIDTLCRLLDAGVTQFHVVKECEDILLDHDYRKLDIGERWELMAGGRLCKTISINAGCICNW